MSKGENANQARMVLITGTVQGVGFRPFVYRLATRLGLAGWVQNGAKGVEVRLEGALGSIEAFLQALKAEAPPLSRIDRIQVREAPVEGLRLFSIAVSDAPDRTADVAHARVPPDVALCPECRREMDDPADRHYGYPFTNCTNCGPRFTIIRQVPYDRAQTSMAAFPMCPACRRDYDDPLDRRFHAQPTACPLCGPRVWFAGSDGQEVIGDWVRLFRDSIRQGNIVALKGLGGFHLVCDGRNATAIAELRRRKRRPAKALAVMGRDLTTLRRICRISDREAAALSGPEAPIVVLERREDAALPSNLAPGTHTLGAMLPYTPLHHLLFDESLDLLVMTSGNPGGLPLVRDNRLALTQLSGIADAFVFHDREIVSRADDSVVRVIDDTLQFYRRSRGYVPEGIPIPWPEGKKDRTLLAVGAEMKNAFALFGRGAAYLSQHIGDVDTCEGRDNYLESLRNLERLLDLSPQRVARDCHPQYRMTALAEEIAFGDGAPTGRSEISALPIDDIQHHHAHLAAVLADNGETGPAIGVILDGTGFGEDGMIRGFEILTGDLRDYRRHFWLRPVPLPGGEAAIRRPWLTAAAFLGEAFGEAGWSQAKALFPDRAAMVEKARRMAEKRLNTTLVSSAGRLFDAVAALLGLCWENSYDGQAAIELGERVRLRLGLTGCGEEPLPVTDGLMDQEEAIVAQPDRAERLVEAALADGEYPMAWMKKEEGSGGIGCGTGCGTGCVTAGESSRETGEIDFGPLLSALLHDREAGVPVEVMASRFHNTIARMAEAAASVLREESGIQRVALGGGVFQNPYLFTLTRRLLVRRGFFVLVPRHVPANDGGLALGQGAISLWRGE
ncbi:[nife] hydrogenase maturation protein hypf [Heliomicrobium modesticaldum Ice1]|uniref:Carbamoyltransferase n=1 Tax=Heliobacterium modesticaldum (strain ATCC 51547 / Ice1) TaxID=498761 RepID=B0TCN1_HELMI|nr:carbamoyltransferase HypF [Heliomicrobium modesticaldum]ABZ84057.1 [nife] hydrogenase maturation protein hypf [Heliomicrobium modesticaldum Ice1]